MDQGSRQGVLEEFLGCMRIFYLELFFFIHMFLLEMVLKSVSAYISPSIHYLYSIVSRKSGVFFFFVCVCVENKDFFQTVPASHTTLHHFEKCCL